MPAGAEAAALLLRAASKRFGHGASAVQALQDVHADVPAGSITGLFGPDGAGKTTLLRLAAALLQPDAGQVLVLGHDTATHSASIPARIGYMPQRFGLYDELTVQENLRLYADLQGLPEAQRGPRFAELLRLTALGPFGRRLAGALSGGMRQKLGLACVLLRQPELLLLDEPTVGVDPISRRELWDIIRDMRGRGSSVLVSTAYLDEAQWCDHILLLQQGRLLAQGTPASFLDPLRGRCHLVRSAGLGRRALQLRLQQRAGVVDAQLHGEDVRVVVEAEVAPRQTGEDWLPREPLFEDAFVVSLRAGVAAAQPRPLPAAQPRQPSQAAGGTQAPTVIEVRSLRRSFGDFVAVKDIDFEVRQGEVFGLLGANGAGKSTTFRMLCGLLRPSAGSLRVAGADMRHASVDARARIGYVAQRFALYANLSVAQNLEFFASAYGLRGMPRRQRLQWAMEEFDLAAVARTGAAELAQGYRQRLALACALMHQPQVLFLDEPTSGVDPLARREFWQRINGLAEQGVTVLVTTHFMDEAEYCDRLVLMSLGEILASGSPREVRARARSPLQPDPDMSDAFVSLVQAHEAVLRRQA